MRCSRLSWGGTLLVAPCLVMGCGSDTIVDDFPGYEVSGMVQRDDGTPVAQGFVEVHIYSELECGATVWGYSSVLTDDAGRYHIQQDGPDAVPTGCLRVTAHGGSDPLSEPTVSVDTVVQEADVVDGDLSIMVDLTFAD
jgi:hypothetical protein